MPSDAEQTSTPEPDRLDHEEFARFYSRHARPIYAFIMTLVFSHHDAEEVFQNTSVVLWDKFCEFRRGSNFFAWASRIAYYEVLNYFKQQRRAPVVSVQAMEALATEASALSDRSVDRVEALSECLARLATADREIIQDRYFYKRPPKQIAAMRSRSLDSIYRSLSRIHNVLLGCVQRTLAREEGR